MKFLSKITFTENKLWLAAAFLAGALIGSVVTWALVDKKEFTVILPSEKNKKNPLISAVESADAEQKMEQTVEKQTEKQAEQK